jgi:hypothetical protein
MRLTLGLLALAVALCLWLDRPAQAAEPDAVLLDAIALLMLGAEAGQIRASGAPPVRRSVDGSGIEYTLVESNPGFAVGNLRPKSKFKKQVVRVDALQKCWFSLRALHSYSKGEAPDDFDQAAATKSVTDLDLRNPFELRLEPRHGVLIKGAEVVCMHGKCGSEFLIGIGNYGSKQPPDGERDLSSVERAIALVKERCPGTSN